GRLAGGPCGDPAAALQEQPLRVPLGSAQFSRASLPAINAVPRKGARHPCRRRVSAIRKRNETVLRLAVRHQKAWRIGYLAGERSNSGPRRLAWSQLRPSVVVPIGVIVAVAIVCV